MQFTDKVIDLSLLLKGSLKCKTLISINSNSRWPMGQTHMKILLLKICTFVMDFFYVSLQNEWLPTESNLSIVTTWKL